jgi:hypothetical protein
VSFWLYFLLAFLIASLFCWYLSPYSERNPGKIKRFIARTWVVFRRIISFAGVIFCFFVIYVIWVSSEKGYSYNLFSTAFWLMLALFFAYVGIFGQGWDRNSFSDDIKLYKQVKKKYGIR